MCSFRAAYSLPRYMDRALALLLAPRDPGHRLPLTTLLPQWYRDFTQIALQSSRLTSQPTSEVIKETNLLASIMRHGARHGLCEEPQGLIATSLSQHRILAGPEREMSFVQHWRDAQDCVSFSISSSISGSLPPHQLISLSYLHGCDILTLIHRPSENGRPRRWLCWNAGIQSAEGSSPLGLVTLYQQECARLLCASPIDPADAELLALQTACAPDSPPGNAEDEDEDNSNAESSENGSDGTTDSNRHLSYTASGKSRRAMGDWDHRLHRMNSVMPMLLSDSVEAYMEQIGLFPPMRSAVRAVCDSCEPSTCNGDHMEVQNCLEPLLELYGNDVLSDFLSIYLSGFEP